MSCLFRSIPPHRCAELALTNSNTCGWTEEGGTEGAGSFRVIAFPTCELRRQHDEGTLCFSALIRHLKLEPG